ncbi:AGAP000159-PA-like protein [Anopheles sinensis]|uniref:AGAP000159-PA-like protein n=1 Tax=Anopheles sinensis TaxID=74873 RepID=A0A084WAB8_ANOSI|nr:AGAP000159-PA-like protein [Anopheles sinensis]
MSDSKNVSTTSSKRAPMMLSGDISVEMRKQQAEAANAEKEWYKLIEAYRNTEGKRKPLPNVQAAGDDPVRVCVRTRPRSLEKRRSEVGVVWVRDSRMLIVHEPQTSVFQRKHLKNREFRFDYTFKGVRTKCNTAKPLVQSVLNGAIATCFAYGPLRSGKTYTMAGNIEGTTVISTNSGLYAFAARDLCNLRKSKMYRGKNLQVFDLGAGVKCRELKKGTEELVLKEKVMGSYKEFLAFIQSGNRRRNLPQTVENFGSFESHTIVSLTLEARGQQLLGPDPLYARGHPPDGRSSFSALEELFRAIRSPEILPFDGNWNLLAKVLEGSFVGVERSRRKACVIATIAPGMTSCEETLNTLRKAQRLKDLAVELIELIDPPDELMEIGDPASGTGTPENDNGLPQHRTLNEPISEPEQKEEEFLRKYQR